ncbi:hydrolase Nlp/P60 [Paenibacillus elgii]|uniref:Hydrolase Nlp/P60 n=1 Tax=Paenibacillus elgii TaxID=189691 RepID=A0A2T6GAN6_9BACL|nr:SH3 domain-containing C40 family peptidase [Paenibacillus elgii]PUA41225.1 hydrolase Nlp/P60 [Paenibacillus elgii]
MKKQLTALLLATTVTFSVGALTAEQALAASNATIVSGVNFRKAPNTDSATYGLLKTGAKVDILDKVNNYWYKVRDDQGRVGYISTSSKYVHTDASGGSTPNGGGSSNSGGSSNGGSTSKPSAGNNSEIVNKVIAAGKKYMGTPYEFGSDRSNTRTFDCSDFTRQAFKEGAGITLPSDSRGQAAYVKSLGGTTTDWHKLKPGDLMFFMDYKGTKASAYPSDKSNQRISHVGIYLGDGKILHTYSKTSGGVRIDSIAGKHWEYRFAFGGSALK